jgi:hypothetical protein
MVNHLNQNAMETFYFKKWMLLFLFIIFETMLSAQKIYKVEYESQADIKVYIVDYESQADLCVYYVNYESQANKPGLWFKVEYESQANKKVYFVEYESQADLKIFIVKFESQAGWKNNSKRHLLDF